ncbi:MAG: ATP-binding protein [Burkholderiaceae bacterium]
MGRLFWKVFLGFWLVILIAAGIVAFAVYASQQEADTDFAEAGNARAALYSNRWVNERLRRYSAVLSYGGERALRRLMREDEVANRESRNARRWPRPAVLVVGASGEELLGRPIPPRAWQIAQRRIERAGSRELTSSPPTTTAPSRQSGIASAPGVRRVDLAGGETWWMFVPRTAEIESQRRQRSILRQISPAVAGVIALLFSLVFSGALAWYLARPIRALRDGFEAVAAGKLDTRVSPQIGARRDELADLGRNFDQTTARLQQLIQSQQRLLHDVSHELRSPLARIQAAIGLLDQSPDRVAELTGRIEQESARLDTLVGEILTLSRLNDQGHTTSHQTFDLNDLLADLLIDARFEAEAAGKSVALTGEVNASVLGDQGLIQRACENLIRNAIRYSPEGKTVDIIVSESEERASQTLGESSLQESSNATKEGHWVAIEICDRGPGMAESELRAVLEPFARGRHTHADGFGLGLAIANRAAQIHGGSLELVNREGGGLCARFAWPVNNLAMPKG